MAHDRRFEAFLDDLARGRLSRREVFKRGAALGIGASALSTVLAARPGMARAAAQGGTVVVNSNQSDPEPRRFMEETTVPAFTQATGIEVELNTSDHEAFKTAIRGYLAADEPPDVLTWFAGNRMRFFVERELVLPVTDVFEQEGWTTAYPEGILAVSRGADDQYYFVPNNYYWWAVYYRPSVFQRAGIEAPPQTFEELLTACEALRAAEITPITIATKTPAWPAAGWFDYLNMRTNGPEFHVQLTDGQAAYNSPEVKETFANWRRLIDAGAFIENSDALEWQDALTPMVQGEAGMFLLGNFIRDSFPDDQEEDLDFFRFPIIDPALPVGEDAPTDGFFAAANARNVEQAKAFLAYVGGRENQEAGARELDRLAVNQEVPLDLYPPQSQKGLQMLQEADYIAQFYDRDTLEEMANEGMAAFQRFLSNPDDVDSILDDLDEERKRIFEEANQ